MLCKNCGSELNENSLFCNRCGFAVEKESVADLQPITPENDSESQQSQNYFFGKAASVYENTPSFEAVPPAEAVPAFEAAPAAPAAKKHNILLYIIIVLAVIIAVMIFKKPSDTKYYSYSSSPSDKYSSTYYSSSSSLSSEEKLIVGTWYAVALIENENVKWVSKGVAYLYLYDDLTGKLTAGGNTITFDWNYSRYNGGYFYIFNTSGADTLMALYDGTYILVSNDGNNTVVFEK